MADQSGGSKRVAKRAGGQMSPGRFVLPMVFGLIAGTAVFAGYLFRSQAKTQQTLVAAPGDPDLAKPSAVECAIAQAAVSAIHASGDDARWEAAAGVKAMSLRAASQTVNPSDVPGFSDDEADDLRGKTTADWRACAGMGAFVRGVGWSPINPDESVANLALGRPGVNQAGDEAKAYETFVVPQPDDGSLRTEGGPWLVTLHKSADGAWRVTAAAALPRPGH
jgi:hypothetical protein